MNGCFRNVITRYPCKAGHETELSFEANQVILNGKTAFCCILVLELVFVLYVLCAKCCLHCFKGSPKQS